MCRPQTRSSKYGPQTPAAFFATPPTLDFLKSIPDFSAGDARPQTRKDYRFRTVMPGSYGLERGAERCPHVNVMVLAVGLTRRLVTTAFFQGHASSAGDPVLQCIGGPEVRRRLFAVRNPSIDWNGLLAYRFDLVLRGENETPFFVD
jgi:protocatechuate 3,4-dioxygenase beta subunit